MNSSSLEQEQRALLAVRIGAFLPRDMDRVLEIQRTTSEPRSWEQFLPFLLQWGSPRYSGLVALAEERDVVGFLMFEILRNRVRLRNLVVDPACRRRGVGTHLVEDVTHRPPEVALPRVTVAVRERNLPAQLFFRSQGFIASEILWDFFKEPRDNAYKMEHSDSTFLTSRKEGDEEIM